MSGFHSMWSTVELYSFGGRAFVSSRLDFHVIISAVSVGNCGIRNVFFAFRQGKLQMGEFILVSLSPKRILVDSK